MTKLLQIYPSEFWLGIKELENLPYSRSPWQKSMMLKS